VVHSDPPADAPDESAEPRTSEAGGASEPPEGPPAWGRVARIGPLVMVAAIVATAILAVISVTPSDEDALARPAGAGVVIAGAAPSSWDPARIFDAASAQVLSQVYEGLTALDAAAQVRPALAESWTVSEGGHRIEFTLRPGAAFSDGTPLTAADVRRSWLRVLDPARPGPLASLLADIEGAADYQRGTAGPEDVGIEAEGDRLTVRFSRPAAWFTAVAAVPTLAVVPAGLDASAGGPGLPPGLVASGAYVPVEQAGDRIELRASERYWAGPAAIEHVSVLTDLGGRSRVDVFESGAVDWTTIAESDASWIRYDSQLGPQLRRTEEMTVDLLGFDTTRPPFDDARVRRAVALAVDWRRLARLAGHSAFEVTSLLPPGIPGRGEQDHLPAHDPAAARAELAAAGYPGGEGFAPLALSTYGVGAPAAIAAELARELGIEVVVERRPFEQHSALLDSDTPAMWTLAWSADYPHAHDFLGLLLRSDSSANAGGWSDVAYDELIDAAAATDDPVEQARLYAAAQGIVSTEAPLVPLGYGGTWALGREGLLGAQVSGVGIMRLASLAWDR
jgi:oligopeptide transport system substrate-binding protein